MCQFEFEIFNSFLFHFFRIQSGLLFSWFLHIFPTSIQLTHFSRSFSKTKFSLATFLYLNNDRRNEQKCMHLNLVCTFCSGSFLASLEFTLLSFVWAKPHSYDIYSRSTFCWFSWCLKVQLLHCKHIKLELNWNDCLNTRLQMHYIIILEFESTKSIVMDDAAVFDVGVICEYVMLLHTSMTQFFFWIVYNGNLMLKKAFNQTFAFSFCAIWETISIYWFSLFASVTDSSIFVSNSLNAIQSEVVKHNKRKRHTNISSLLMFECQMKTEKPMAVAVPWFYFIKFGLTLCLLSLLLYVYCTAIKIRIEISFVPCCCYCLPNKTWNGMLGCELEI